MPYPPPQRPDPARVTQVLDVVTPLSDRGREGLEAWAAIFVEAHLRAPGGLSIEVGTRIGGSALMFAALLELMYGETQPPPLWTVDPYGGKPYVDGFGGEFPGYGDDVYLAMKQNLLKAPNHAHWMMPSSFFFRHLRDMPFWRPGSRTVPSFVPATGEQRSERIGECYAAGAESATFILHDGEHEAKSIATDLGLAWPWLRSGGAVVVVDNVDSDAATALWMRDHAARKVTPFVIEPSGRWAHAVHP